MKKNFFFMAAFLVAMAGCNKETEMKEKDSISPEDKVYMTFTIKTPTTRSATDTEGTTNSNANPDYEVGMDYENTISKVDIVLTNADSYVVAEDVEPSGSVGNKYIASFSSLELKADTEYDVYIYANCDAPATTKDLHATSNATIAEMTKDDNFWMTNAYEAKSVKLPVHMSAHTSPASPLNLGAHSVERSMARIDFNPNKGYQFWIENSRTLIQLTDAAIINHSIDFYQLRRVSADGTNKDWVVGGIETPENYVVDADYDKKINGVNDNTFIRAKKGEQLASYMQLPEDWEWKELPRDNDDNWTEAGTDEEDLNQYKIWQYCKENTIPGVDAQQKGHTTGVVFRGRMTSTDEKIMTSMSEKKTIFVFENVLYGSWEQVKEAAKAENAPATLVYAVAKAEDRLKFANEQEDEATREGNIKMAYADSGFTGFSPDENGTYYSYYYYWIRHNDNGDNALMGPMEFAVVRNNVYKLRVDGIYKYGHPTPNTDPDPDPEDPTDPDESLNYYFNVTVDVLPWTVRVNNIEF
jgi:hypothetical protein